MTRIHHESRPYLAQDVRQNGAETTNLRSRRRADWTAMEPPRAQGSQAPAQGVGLPGTGEPPPVVPEAAVAPAAAPAAPPAAAAAPAAPAFTPAQEALLEALHTALADGGLDLPPAGVRSVGAYETGPLFDLLKQVPASEWYAGYRNGTAQPFVDAINAEILAAAGPANFSNVARVFWQSMSLQVRQTGLPV